MESYMGNSSSHQKALDIHPFRISISLSQSLHSDPKSILRFFFHLLIRRFFAVPCLFLAGFNLLICLPLGNLFAQQPTQEWATRYERPITSGVLVNFMALDKLGNVYVLGRIYSTATLADMVLIKYNSTGDTVWTRIYNHTSNNDDEPHGLAVDSIGNAYVTGKTGPNSGAGDIITLKYSPTGSLLWAKIYTATPTSNESGNGIALDKQGNNIYVAGSISTLGASVTIRYNTSGDSIWVKVKTQPGFQYFGKRLAINSTGDIFTGGTRFNISTNEDDIMVIKYDLLGTEQWTSVYVNSALDADRGIAADNSGNVYICGAINAGGNSNYVTVKYNSAGIQQWARVYNGTGNTSDEPYGIAVDNNGNVIVTGASGGIGTDFDYLTVKYNSIGDSVWVKRYNGSGNDNDEAYSIVTDDSGNSYITGRSIGAGTSWDYATIKYNTTGAEQWVERFNANPPGNGEDIAYKIAIDNQQNIFVTGISKRVTSIYDYLTIKYSQPVGINPISNGIPKEFYLYQNYPNPFNPSTQIAFDISERTNVSLKVYDLLGREIAVLVNDKLNAGKYNVEFNAGSIASGIYFYRLNTDNFIETMKMLLIK